MAWEFSYLPPSKLLIDSNSQKTPPQTKKPNKPTKKTPTNKQKNNQTNKKHQKPTRQTKHQKNPGKKKHKAKIRKKNLWDVRSISKLVEHGVMVLFRIIIQSK